MTLLRAGETCSIVAEARRAGLLLDAASYYRALYHALAGARRQILMAGWQFDSRVRLLRGEEARRAAGPVELLPLLDHLCRVRPELRVHVLSWKPNVVYVFERELFQRARFRIGRSDDLEFVFDDVHPVGATHHQKMVVVDGWLAFAGGMDVAADRWDERAHAPDDPERHDPKGKPYGPYHDVQAFVTGPAAGALHAIFRERWARATEQELPTPEIAPPERLPFEPDVELPPGPVGISRTQGAMANPWREKVTEVRQLFVEAIGQAEQSIYLEFQYLTSQDVEHALVERLSASGRPRLSVLIILPRQAEALKEAVALGARQTAFIDAVTRAARDHGHGIGVYHPVSERPTTATYVHSKVLIVDARVLSVGSSNLTNRSMGLDSELNLTWEAAGPGALAAAIGRVRAELLAEHCGVLGEPESRAALLEPEHLVERVEELRRRHGRLVPFEPALPWLARVAPEDMGLDPERAEIEEAFQDAVRPFRRVTRVVRRARRLLRG